MKDTRKKNKRTKNQRQTLAELNHSSKYLQLQQQTSGLV